MSSRQVTVVLVACRLDCRAWGDREMKMGTAVHSPYGAGVGVGGAERPEGRQVGGRCVQVSPPAGAPLGKPQPSSMHRPRRDRPLHHEPRGPWGQEPGTGHGGDVYTNVTQRLFIYTNRYPVTT